MNLSIVVHFQRRAFYSRHCFAALSMWMLPGGHSDCGISRKTCWWLTVSMSMVGWLVPSLLALIEVCYQSLSHSVNHLFVKQND